QFLQGFSRFQVLAGEPGEAGCITKGAEERKSARGTAATRSATARAALHRLELPLLVLREQRLEPRVDLLLNLLQTFLLTVGELQGILLGRGEELAGLWRIVGAGTARRGAGWAEDRLELFLLNRGQHSVKPAVDRLLKGECVFLLVVRQFQSVLFGAGHD